jgi:low affinity Fe/Cu permease
VFRAFSEKISQWTGTPYAFGLAVSLVLAWALSGPVFNFSDTWQLAINTATTISTFLMTFLIQYTQNRDNRALHLKLDELVRANPAANDELIDVEKLSDEEIERVYQAILKRRKS